jgi:hypothetical protein
VSETLAKKIESTLKHHPDPVVIEALDQFWETSIASEECDIDEVMDEMGRDGASAAPKETPNDELTITSSELLYALPEQSQARLTIPATKLTAADLLQVVKVLKPFGVVKFGA